MASGEGHGSAFAFPSSSEIYRRPAKSGRGAPPPPAARGRGGPLALHPDIDPPPPPPRPAFQLLAFALILLFAALQFLPATHFRDPSDPLRRWIPFGSEPGSSSVFVISLRVDSKLIDQILSRVWRLMLVPRWLGLQTLLCCVARCWAHNSNLGSQEDVERIDIVSWVDCLDLRVLAVLINSTLSSSRVPDKVHFHFLISENEEEKSSYYKLKVLFPDGNFVILGQKEIKDGTKIASPAGEQFWPSVRDLVPVVIPRVYPSLSRFIYVSPDTIMKGSVEELFGVHLGTYAMGATEDCSRRLGSYINIDVLNAIQRTATKTWVSEKPYDENACAPDLNVLLVNAKKLDKYLVEAFLWWNKVLDIEPTGGDETNPSIILALYQKYLKLSATWKLVSKAPAADDKIKVIGYDGEMRVCSEIKTKQRELSFGDVWRHYLPSKSEIILGHRN